MNVFWSFRQEEEEEDDDEELDNEKRAHVTLKIKTQFKKTN